MIFMPIASGKYFRHPAILCRILVAHQSPCEVMPADTALVALEEQVAGDKREGATRKKCLCLAVCVGDSSTVTE